MLAGARPARRAAGAGDRAAHPARPVGHAGRPVHAGRVRAQPCLPADEPGEIVVSGEHVLTGYLHGRGDDETKFRVDGAVWHRTGDAGYLDDRGRLWLLGRCVARIDDARGELYPFAAETAVYQDARVKRAAVVGHNGRRLLAVGVVRRRRSRATWKRSAQILAWARIDEVRVWPPVPVDNRHNAKIDYPAPFRAPAGRQGDKRCPGPRGVEYATLGYDM